MKKTDRKELPLPLVMIHEIQESKLPFNKDLAIRKVLKQWKDHNELFRRVMMGETTFEEYFSEFVEDNLGLGIFKRWSLKKEYSAEISLNIVEIFQVQVWRSGGRGPSWYVQFNDIPIKPCFFSALGVSLLGSLFTLLILIVAYQEWQSSWFWACFIGTVGVVIGAFTPAMVCHMVDSNFEERRACANILFSHAQELDSLIAKYRVKI